MPLRDDRRGRRATIGSGDTPFRREFSSPAAEPVTPADAARAPTSDEPATNGRSGDDLAEDADMHASLAADIRPEDEPLAGEAVSSFDVRRSPSDVRAAVRSELSPAVSQEAAHALAVTDAAQRRSLMEPSAVLMALARPLLGLRSALLRFVNVREAPMLGARPAETAPREESRADVIIERSFASEVASLLGTPAQTAQTGQSMQSTERPDVRPSPGVPATTTPAIDDFAASSTPLFSRLEGATLSARKNRREASDRTDDTSTMSDNEPGTPNAQTGKFSSSNATAGELWIARPSEPNTSQANKFERAASNRLNGDGPVTEEADAVGSASSLDDTAKSPIGNDVIVSHSAIEQNIVVSALPFRSERAVPITRLPLRPQGFEITWPAQLPEPERSRPLSRPERHELLERFVRNPGTVSSDTIARAYREEEGIGRSIALRVLLRNFPQAGRSSFIEALRVGSDEERAVAVDGLTAIGALEELTPAFSDRVDAIAAKAALSYVGTFERADYREQLSTYIDETQIDAILRLLAGVVE